MRIHRGFTLIEVLVALVVLSIGLLGIAALHGQGVQFGQAALQTTRAVALAADMADRIRANPNAIAVYGAAGAAPAGGAPDAKCADDDDGRAPRDCTPDEMAAYDIWQWRTALEGTTATGLPNGTGSIALNNATTPPTLGITVGWTERGDDRSYTLRVQP